MDEPGPGKKRKMNVPQRLPKPDYPDGRPRIELSTPWSDVRNALAHTSGPQSVINYSDETARAFIEERTRLHTMYIQEEAKTKRMALLISALLALGGGMILIFAPETKQLLADWVGASLFVAAGGAAGYKRLWFKSKNTTVGAQTD